MDGARDSRSAGAGGTMTTLIAGGVVTTSSGAARWWAWDGETRRVVTRGSIERVTTPPVSGTLPIIAAHPSNPALALMSNGDLWALAARPGDAPTWKARGNARGGRITDAKAHGVEPLVLVCAAAEVRRGSRRFRC